MISFIFSFSFVFLQFCHSAIHRKRIPQIHNWCVWITCWLRKGLRAPRREVVSMLLPQRLLPLVSYLIFRFTTYFNPQFNNRQLPLSRFVFIRSWWRQCHWTFRLPCQIGANPTNLPPRIGKIRTSLQRVYHARHEFVARTKSHASHHPERDRTHGANYPSEIQLDPDATEAVHMWGCHDFTVPILGCTSKTTQFQQTGFRNIERILLQSPKQSVSVGRGKGRARTQMWHNGKWFFGNGFSKLHWHRPKRNSFPSTPHHRYHKFPIGSATNEFVTRRISERRKKRPTYMPLRRLLVPHLIPWVDLQVVPLRQWCRPLQPKTAWDTACLADMTNNRPTMAAWATIQWDTRTWVPEMSNTLHTIINPVTIRIERMKKTRINNIYI